MESIQGMWQKLPGMSTDTGTATLKVNSTGHDRTASSENPTTIAANDFLTLLVTEMKNQDPTATTDPNEYVNQLVQVNSLQQLISINETLKEAVGSDSVVAPEKSAAGASRTAIQTPELGNVSAAAPTATGKVSMLSAAQRVATALTGR